MAGAIPTFATTRMLACGIALLALLAPETVTAQDSEVHVATSESGAEEPPTSIDEVFSYTDAIDFLSLNYSRERRLSAVVNIISGSAMLFAGVYTLFVADVNLRNVSLRAYATTFLVIGPANLADGLITWFGPVSDAELEANTLARDPDTTPRRIFDFLDRRAQVARRNRYVRGVGSLIAALTTFLIPQGTDEQPFAGTTLSYATVLTTYFATVGVVSLARRSPEERLLRRTDAWPSFAPEGWHIALAPNGPGATLRIQW